MRSNIQATNIEITPAIRDYIEKRFSAFDKFIHDKESALCEIEVGKTTKHHRTGDVFRAEVNLRTSGRNIYVGAETDDLYASIDQVKDEVIHKLTTNKEKSTTIYRQGALRLKNILKGLDFRGRFRKK